MARADRFLCHSGALWDYDVTSHHYRFAPNPMSDVCIKTHQSAKHYQFLMSFGTWLWWPGNNIKIRSVWSGEHCSTLVVVLSIPRKFLQGQHLELGSIKYLISSAWRWWEIRKSLHSSMSRSATCQMVRSTWAHEHNCAMAVVCIAKSDETSPCSALNLK